MTNKIEYNILRLYNYKPELRNWFITNGILREKKDKGYEGIVIPSFPCEFYNESGDKIKVKYFPFYFQKFQDLLDNLKNFQKARGLFEANPDKHVFGKKIVQVFKKPRLEKEKTTNYDTKYLQYKD